MPSIFKSKAKTDEYYTRECDVRLIAENLKPGLHIWCPFDGDESFFPPVLREYGFDVVSTSSDFFEIPVPDGVVDDIVSNPPFSIKREIVRRIDDVLHLPYALIMPITSLGDRWLPTSANQLILWRKRMIFLQHGIELRNPMTNCCLASNGLLKQDFKIVTGDEYEKRNEAD